MSRGENTGDVVILANNTNQQAYAVRDGRVFINGEIWDLAGTAEQIHLIMRERKVPRDAKRARVLAELQLAGCWPAHAALKGYLTSMKESAK